jgi:crossover junction endodeoxyribonuclease RuvC
VGKVILGVDPGLCVAGYSVINCSGPGAKLIDLGFLKQKSCDSVCHRVGVFYEFMQEKAEEYGTSVIALETPFLGRNAQTFLKLGYMRGTLYLLAHKKNSTLLEFSPSEVKLAVTGFGGAKKEQVADALFAMYPLLKEFQCTVRNDVTDALGIGMCAAWKLSQNKMLSRAL